MVTKKKSAKAAKQGAPEPLSPEETVRAVSRTCRGPIAPDMAKKRDAALANGDRQGASALDAGGRPGCGQDVNELIVKAGLDGQEHESACPKCGVLLSWRAPSFEGGEKKGKR